MTVFSRQHLFFVKETKYLIIFLNTQISKKCESIYSRITRLFMGFGGHDQEFDLVIT